MRKLTRRVVILGILAAVMLAAAPAAQAADENPPYRDDSNGRIVKTFYGPGGCRVEVAVDTQYGFTSTAEETASLARPVGRITAVAGVVAVQVDSTRLRGHSADPFNSDDVVNDPAISRELFAPADPLNSRETGGRSVTGFGDWMDADVVDDYPLSPVFGDDGLAEGSSFSFVAADDLSSRVYFSARCADPARTLIRPTVATGVSHPATG